MEKVQPLLTQLLHPNKATQPSLDQPNTSFLDPQSKQGLNLLNDVGHNYLWSTCEAMTGKRETNETKPTKTTASLSYDYDSIHLIAATTPSELKEVAEANIV
ncbi:hypothetical protein AgCh_020638 [Apium graveolens]